MAKKYSCYYLTLSRHYYNITTLKSCRYNSQQFLSNAQLKVLLKYINNLIEYRLPPIVTIVYNLATKIIEKILGKNQLVKQIKYYQEEIKTRYLNIIDSKQKKADSALYYSMYFKLLSRKLKEYNLQLQNIYNIDKKGFLISFLKKIKRVFNKQAFNTKRVCYVAQDRNREQITILGAICADRTALLLGLIY